MEANREHLARILAGVETWNAWRRENPYVVAPDLEDANLRGLNLRGADLSKTNLCAVHLENADLSEASFIGANLSGTKLSDTRLCRANFANANIQGTDFSRADLSGADFGGVLFRRAILDDASLEYADLSEAVFRGARLRGTRFTGARLATGFDDVDLSLAQGLDAASHRGPSSFGVNTLYRSAGHLSLSFLRDAGVPDNFLAYVDSLVSRPIEFQSCFISYARRDEAFAAKLYGDLRREGIRCWFAPESLKIGDRFRREIDRSILVHDRLLVILSAASLGSSWVEDEVEAALEREHDTKADVLFPLRVDSEVMATSTAWAAALRRTRHIGDFCSWDEPGKYKPALGRLLRDLRIASPRGD